MRIAILNSAIDPAGVNIREHLLSILGEGTCFTHRGHTLSFHEVKGKLIYETGLDARLSADLIIFISRHTSSRPRPALTVHVTGNYRDAALGGEAGTLAKASPEWMHAVLNALPRSAPEGYEVSYEVTHHGPTDLVTPSFFVEIGSTETEWTDPAAGEAVARAILEAVPVETINMIGFGGTHYASRQTAIALSSRAAWGHIAHSREVEWLKPEMVRQMQEMSGAEAAYMDRKDLSHGVCQRIESIIGDLGMLCLAEHELLEIGDLSWDTYLEIRQLAEGIAPGSRCHLHKIPARGRPVSFEIQADLLKEALKIDETRFMENICDLPVVHLTSPDGKFLPIFISYEVNRSELLHGFIFSCILIITSDPATDVSGDQLILRKLRFDPEKARSLGVPSGPLYGRLAAGDQIEVCGKVITPAMVSRSSVREIRVPGLERYL